MFAENMAAGPKEKELICHIGSQEGPGGETYLDDPACIPSEQNAYFCPDAGKVDLIVVASASKHFGNLHHAYAGFSDYRPGEVGAMGDSTEDSNSNGIDVGCEPVEACRCWAESDLLSVTAENLSTDITLNSCSMGSVLPNFAAIQNVPGSTPDVEGGFVAQITSQGAFCQTRDIDMSTVLVPEQEALACIAQIVARCAAVGDPI